MVAELCTLSAVPKSLTDLEEKGKRGSMNNETAYRSTPKNGV